MDVTGAEADGDDYFDDVFDGGRGDFLSSGEAEQQGGGEELAMPAPAMSGQCRLRVRTDRSG